MKKIVFFFSILLLLMACNKILVVTKTKKVSANTKLDWNKINKVVGTALSYKGTPYQWGGTGKKGMDCSGLMLVAFKSINLDIPRIAGDQAAIGLPVTTEELEEGDLVFFTDKPGDKEVTHVGMVSKVNEAQKEILFVHASSKGVMESELLSEYWQGVFLKAARPKAFILP